MTIVGHLPPHAMLAPTANHSRLLIVAIVLLALGRLAVADFTWWDDNGTIHQNPALNPPTLRSVAPYWTAWGRRAPLGLYIPVTYTVWAALAKVAYLGQPDELGIRLNPYVFHAANLLVHTISSLLVFQVLRKLLPTNQVWPATVGALLFAIHPVQVETVGWISGMKDLLCGAMSLGALLLYLDGSRTRFAIATVLLLLAMLSKPTAMVLPAIALAIDFFVRDRSPRRSIRRLSPWMILSVACMIWTRMAQAAPSSYAAPPLLRPLIAIDALGFYLERLAVPFRLAVDYGHTPTRALTGFAWIGRAVIVLCVFAVCRIGVTNPARRNYLLAGTAILVIGLAPVLGFVPFFFEKYSGVADHYLYLPMLGFALACAWICSRFDSRPTRIATAGIIVLLAVRSFDQTAVWHDDVSLWSQSLNVNPDSTLAHVNFGAALERAGSLDLAEAHYRDAVRLDPTEPAARDNLADLLRKRAATTAPSR